jgi:hypothetical protein
VERAHEVHFLLSFDHFEVIDDRTALRVGEGESGGVGHPAMDSSSSGVDPQEVFESKVV